MGWEPIDITTPVAWHGFCGRQIGKTSWGFAAALSWHSLYLGLQIICAKPNGARGIGLALGPLWVGIARLAAKDIRP
jgi:hypothetical protein